MPKKIQMNKELLFRSHWMSHWMSMKIGEVLEFGMEELFHDEDLEVLNSYAGGYDPTVAQTVIQHKRCALASSARYAKPDMRVRTAVRRVGHEGRIEYAKADPEDLRLYVWYEEYTPVELDGKEVK